MDEIDNNVKTMACNIGWQMNESKVQPLYRIEAYFYRSLFF